MSNEERQEWTNLPHGKVGDKALAEKLSSIFGGTQEEWYKELTPEQKSARDEILARPNSEPNNDWSYLPTPKKFQDLFQRKSK